jgi:cytochrome c oxidase assembly factor CtaG
MRAVVLLAFAALLAAPLPAFAHFGQIGEHRAQWTFDPWIVIPLFTAAVLYSVGTIVLSRRSGHGLRPWQVTAYAAGWLALAGALVSPLHWLGEHLFTVHMIEHEIVMAIAAPLIVLARPTGILLWGLPRGVRHAIGRIAGLKLSRVLWALLTRPSHATILHGVAIWVWHVPLLFDAAVLHESVHRLQHLSFFLTALLFWWALVRRSRYGTATWHLFVTMIHTTVLGALMALAPRVLYTAQTADAASWGLTPLEDQQLAGIVMWVPAGSVYAGAALVFAALWIARSAAESQALRGAEL